MNPWKLPLGVSRQIWLLNLSLEFKNNSFEKVLNLVHQNLLVCNTIAWLIWPGSQQCIVTISCDSGWTGIPDVRYDEAGSSGDGGGGGDDDEDGISFLKLFNVSDICPSMVQFLKSFIWLQIHYTWLYNSTADGIGLHSVLFSL